jgi:transposase, IS5 family
VTAASGLTHTVRGTAGSVNDVVVANELLHGKERDVFADAGYQGAHKRPGARKRVRWHVDLPPSSRTNLK